MTQEEQRLHKRRHERIARVKRFLRKMPRRATIHKWPILKWSAKAAKKRSYLWCFRVRSAVPALYAGCILSLLPIYGIQLPLALLLSFVMRANLPILTSLQFITNPVTVVPVYYAAYQVGRVVLNVFGVESVHLNMGEMKVLMDSIQAGNWSYNFHYIGKVWLVTSLGSFILGTFLGTITSVIYKIAAYEVTVSYKRLKHLQEKRQAKIASGEVQALKNMEKTHHG